MINRLFESGEIIKKKLYEVEQKNIAALKETNREIAEMLNNLPKPRRHKVLYVHDSSQHHAANNFPVDHRIAK